MMIHRLTEEGREVEVIFDQDGYTVTCKLLCERAPVTMRHFQTDLMVLTYLEREIGLDDWQLEDVELWLMGIRYDCYDVHGDAA